MIRRCAAVLAAVVAAWLVLGAGGGPQPAEAALTYIRVTNSQDSGAGSLRAAITKANSATSGPIIVIIATAAPIRLDSTIMYTNTLPLTLQRPLRGQMTIIENRNPADCLPGMFYAPNGADITIKDVTFRNNACNGVVVESSNPRTGKYTVTLSHVVMRDIGGQGVFVGDHPFGDNTSIELQVELSTFENIGASAIVLSEEGSGDGKLSVTNTSIRGGCPTGGVFAREGQAGNLEVKTNQLRIRDCDGSGLEAYENGDGSLKATFTKTELVDNDGSGIRLDEEDAGNLDAQVTSSKVTGSGVNGVAAAQATPGYGKLRLTHSSVTGSGSDNFDLDGVVQY